MHLRNGVDLIYHCFKGENYHYYPSYASSNSSSLRQSRSYVFPHFIWTYFSVYFTLWKITVAEATQF